MPGSSCHWNRSLLFAACLWLLPFTPGLAYLTNTGDHFPFCWGTVPLCAGRLWLHLGSQSCTGTRFSDYKMSPWKLHHVREGVSIHTSQGSPYWERKNNHTFVPTSWQCPFNSTQQLLNGIIACYPHVTNSNANGSQCIRGYSAIRHPRYTVHEEDAEVIKLPSGTLGTFKRNASRWTWRRDNGQDRKENWAMRMLAGRICTFWCLQGAPVVPMERDPAPAPAWVHPPLPADLTKAEFDFQMHNHYSCSGRAQKRVIISPSWINRCPSSTTLAINPEREMSLSNGWFAISRWQQAQRTSSHPKQSDTSQGKQPAAAYLCSRKEAAANP